MLIGRKLKLHAKPIVVVMNTDGSGNV